MILSIDVGIKNLAMCLLDEDKNNLLLSGMWMVYPLNIGMVCTSP